MGERCGGGRGAVTVGTEAPSPHHASLPPRHRLSARSPALAGRWGRPGDTLLLCSAGCCGDRSRGSVWDDVTREGVTREPLGLLNCREL